MNLPPSLKSWAPQLTIFPVEISLAIGAMAQRIAPFVGSLQSSAKIAGGEPDGYDGIARRGLYTRLLLSELALADELPEEFLRRAAMNEHLFLQLARVEPSSQSVSVALFDAGADQLGTPRIAHLAALIVLERRAKTAKAKFFWGVLQKPENEFFEAVTPENVSHLLAARTAAPVDDETIQKWRERLKNLSETNDVWLVGSNHLNRLSETTTTRFSILSVEDVLEPEENQLNLKVRGASGAQRSVVLDLPEQAVCTRLLRDPFAAARPRPQSVDFAIDRIGNLLFNEQGNKLLIKLGQKSVGLLNVPNSPNANPVYPKKYQNYLNNLVSVGNWNQSILLLTLKDKTLHLYYAKQGKFHLPAGDYVKAENSKIEFAAPADDDVLLPTFNLWLNKSSDFEAAILDANQTLFRLSALPKEKRNDVVGKMDVIVTKVLAVARLAHNFVFVGQEFENEFPRIVSIGEKIERKNVPLPSEPHRVLFGYGQQVAHPLFGLLALEATEQREWLIITANGDVRLRQNAQTTVIGAFQHPAFDPEMGLLELDADKRTIFFNCESRRKQICQSADEITSAVQSQRSPLLAYKTVNNEIAVYSLTHRAEVCRYKSNFKA